MGNKVQVDFLSLENLQVEFTSNLSHFSNAEYETAAKEAGFKSCNFKNLYPDQSVIQKYGQNFWGKCISQQPYQAFICSTR